jgi:hypothetical protein
MNRRPTLPFPSRGDDALSMAESIALLTPLVAAATVFAMKPDADQQSRARVASGLLFATSVMTWGISGEGEEMELPSGGVFEVPPAEKIGSAVAIEFVAVSIDRREVSLSGNSWKVPENIAFREEMAKICHAAYVALASENSLISIAGCLEEEERAILAALGDSARICPTLRADRSWWLEDIAGEKQAVRAKKNVFSAMLALAEARHRVNTEAAAEAAKRAAGLVRMPQPIARGLQRLGRKGGETIAVEVEVQARTPRGITFQLDAKKLERDVNPLARILTPTEVGVYIMTLCAAYDQCDPNLLFEFPISRMIREYIGKDAAKGHVVTDARLALEALTKIQIVEAGDVKLPEGGTPQALIERLVNAGRDRYAHPSLIRAAVFEGTGMVQCPRSVLHGDRRDIQTVLGLSILVRENLQEASKTGRITKGPRELLKMCDRETNAKQTSIGAEVDRLATIADQHGIGLLTVERDQVSLEPSARLFEVYATTIAGPARHAKAAAIKARKR